MRGVATDCLDIGYAPWYTCRPRALEVVTPVPTMASCSERYINNTDGGWLWCEFDPDCTWNIYYHEFPGAGTCDRNATTLPQNIGLSPTPYSRSLYDYMHISMNGASSTGSTSGGSETVLTLHVNATWLTALYEEEGQFLTTAR